MKTSLTMSVFTGQLVKAFHGKCASESELLAYAIKMGKSEFKLSEIQARSGFDSAKAEFEAYTPVKGWGF